MALDLPSSVDVFGVVGTASLAFESYLTIFLFAAGVTVLVLFPCILFTSVA